jgi:hypothetical protein
MKEHGKILIDKNQPLEFSFYQLEAEVKRMHFSLLNIRIYCTNSRTQFFTKKHSLKYISISYWEK